MAEGMHDRETATAAGPHLEEGGGRDPELELAQRVVNEAGAGRRRHCLRRARRLAGRRLAGHLDQGRVKGRRVGHPSVQLHAHRGERQAGGGGGGAQGGGELAQLARGGVGIGQSVRVVGVDLAGGGGRTGRGCRGEEVQR